MFYQHTDIVSAPHNHSQVRRYVSATALWAFLKPFDGLVASEEPFGVRPAILEPPIAVLVILKSGEKTLRAQRWQVLCSEK